MMLFRLVKQAMLEKVFIPDADYPYTVVDYPFHNLGAEAILNDKRTVSAYFDEGDIKGSMTRPDHKMKFGVDMLVAADTKDDLLVLEKQFTFEQNEKHFAALNRRQNAKGRADDLIAEFLDYIFQLIMNPENDQLGLDKLLGYDRLGPRVITDRFVTKIMKGSIQEEGELVKIGAQLTLTCRGYEKLVDPAPLGEPEAGGEIGKTIEANQPGGV